MQKTRVWSKLEFLETNFPNPKMEVSFPKLEFSVPVKGKMEYHYRTTMIDDDVDTESIGKLLLGVWEQGTIYVFPNEGSVDAHYG